MFTSGPLKGARVNGSAGGDLAVSAAGATMNVDIATGVAIVNGGFYENTASLAKTLSASNPSNPRIDRVVIRYDFSGRTVSVQVLTGTPAASPAAPTLTQTATTWEVSLAQVRVDAGVSVIASGKVTDERVFAQANTLGLTVGNATGNIPVSNGTKNVNLNADSLDGKDVSNNSGDIPFNNGTVNTNLNADKLDGYDAGHSSGQVPVSDGTVNTNLNADKLDGLDSSALVQIGSHNGHAFTLSAGTSLPGTLDAYEIFILLS